MHPGVAASANEAAPFHRMQALRKNLCLAAGDAHTFYRVPVLVALLGVDEPGMDIDSNSLAPASLSETPFLVPTGAYYCCVPPTAAMYTRVAAICTHCCYL
jgi:hypothetical protein